MQGKRLDRVNQLIKEEISTLVHRELKDPRLGFVTVTAVDITKDLRTAKVFVSVLGNDQQWACTESLPAGKWFTVGHRFALRSVQTSELFGRRHR